MDDTRISEWCSTLQEKINNNTISIKDHDTLETLDTTFTQIRLNAANQLKSKILNPEVPWSPRLHQAYMQLQYWETKRKELKYGKRYDHRLTQIRNYLQKEPTQEATTNFQILQQIQQARNKYMEIKNQAEELRQHHMWERALAEEIAGNQAAKHVIHQITKTEVVKNNYKMLSSTFKKWQNMSLLILDEVDPRNPNTITHITNK